MSKNTQTSGLVNYIAHSGSIVSVSGSLTVTGSLNVTGGMTGSFQGVATTASYVLNAVSASFATTASYAVSASVATNAVTASYVLNAVSASFATTASYAVSASIAINAVTASYVLNAVSASFATTAVTSSFANAFTVAGTLTATTLVVQTITSSVDFVTGSTRFGSLLANTHAFTGSVGMTGSLAVIGNATATSLTVASSLDGDPSLATFTNANAGTSAEAAIYVRNGATANDATFVQAVGTGFTTIGGFIQDGGVVGTGTGLSGGMSLMVRANADMRFYTNGHTNQRMIITSGGNVGIGTTSPTNGKLVVKSGESNSTGIVLERGSNTDKLVNIFSETADGKIAIASGANTRIFLDSVGNSYFTGGYNVGIGTTSPSQLLDIVGTTPMINIQAGASTNARGIQFNYNGATVIGSLINFGSTRENALSAGSTGTSGYFLTFKTDGTERMRLGSDGIFYYGTTSYNSALKGILFNPNGYSFFTIDGNTVAVGTSAINLNRLNNDGKLLSFQKNTSETGYISTNTYSLPSDFNFKKNINNLDLGLNLINKLRPVSYNHKIDDDNAALSTGFIAQEMEQSLTELGVEENAYFILQHKEIEDKTQSQYWMDYTKMIPILTKAIQEQQATIQSLQTRITQLENK